MLTRLSLLAPLALVLAAAPAPAQFDDLNDPQLKQFSEGARLSAEIVPAKAKRGETVTYRLTLAPNMLVNARTYPISPTDPRQDSKTVLVAPPPGDLIFVTEAKDPAGYAWESKPDKTPSGMELLAQITHKPVTWEMKAVVSPKATSGKKSIKLDELGQIQVCNNSNCLNASGRDWPAATFEVLDGEPVPVDPQYKSAVDRALAPTPPTPVAPPRSDKTDPPRVTPGPQGNNTPSKPAHPAAVKTAKPLESYRAGLESLKPLIDTSGVKPPAQGLGAFVLTAAIWGLVSLVTPCVFPMIPITVSIFLKHAHGSFRERMKLASVYCLTIIGVLGLSAFALLKFMSALSINPVTNVLLGLIFVVLALSLFGMFELALPNFLSRRLQAKQAQGGVVGTIFGALAFTVISFTCVAPFLGGFAGISAADSGGSLIAVPTTKEVLGGLAFATAFAAPFFVLAMIPGLLKALPRSGGWLDSVKVVMGFLELAAALKFFRTAELRSPFGMSFFTYDLVLAGWVAIAFACGLYLLNAYRLPHDEEKPNIGVVRLLFALLFLGLGFYLFPALFKGPEGNPQRPGGAVYAWVDAFLLPEPKAPSRGSGKDDKELTWGTDLKEAVDRVRAEARPRPIFIDFTGKTCSNCRLNEQNVFPKAEVQELFREYERVQLYTDEVPEEVYASDPGYRARRLEGIANDEFELGLFGTKQLPLYVVLVPQASGKFKAFVYPEGAINKPNEFVAFLKGGLEQARK